MPTKSIRDAYETGEETYRIISMDGGGLYGLFSAIMLRRLCERNEHFFDQSLVYKVSMVAGTSAGALNALLLAREEDPRAFILGGGLERFWEEFGIFENSNPVNYALSYFGLRAWLGSDEFKAVLDKYFGDMTFGELPRHFKVLVLTFEWSGREDVPEEERRWTTRYFSNEHESDANIRIADVAYGAASPPPFRALTNGLGDAAIYACNPSLNAYALAKAKAARRKPIALLSVGVGSRESWYWQKAFDLGWFNFNILPTNPMMGAWMPPMLQTLVDAPTESVSISSRQIMGPFYFRLNPGVLGPPNFSPNTTTAIFMSRNRFLHQWLQKVIHDAAKKPEAREALDAAAEFLDGNCWLLGEAESEDWIEEILEALSET